MTDRRLGFAATWAMAVGGMVGGGIFSVLGVVISIAGPRAWLSFVMSGAIAFCTGLSYVGLARRYGEGGGAFTFLREMDREYLAGGVSWLLLVGYMLTMSVYAATFGHYVGDVAGMPAWAGRSLGAAVLITLMAVNLRGVGDASGLEIVTVWGKLAVLLVLAAIGLARWDTSQLTPTGYGGGPGATLLAAASVFVAYEGFQLLTYDYDDIRDPERVLRKAIITSILAVVAIYVAVALGSAMLTGADALIEKQEIALAEAGKAALGTPGLFAVSVAAAFSTASAINATLFATGRLAERVARDGELPEWIESRNSRGIPVRAIVLLTACTVLLLAVGSLRELVESASIVFLGTFACVNIIAAVELQGARRLPAIAGALGASVAGIALLLQWIESQETIPLAALAALLLLGFGVRPLLLRASRRSRTET
jgi:amino acid transporter